jgi:hypothetical protein
MGTATIYLLAMSWTCRDCGDTIEGPPKDKPTGWASPDQCLRCEVAEARRSRRKGRGIKGITDADVLHALDGSKQATVAKRLGIAPATLSVRLQRMVADGLVMRHQGRPYPADVHRCTTCGQPHPEGADDGE